MRIKRVVAAAAVSVGLAGVAPIQAVSSDSAADRAEYRAPVLVIDTVDGVELTQDQVDSHNTIIASRANARRPNNGFNYSQTSNMVNGQVTVVYTEANTPQEVKTAMNAAVSDWAAVVALHPNAPLEIEVAWVNLGDPQLLGSAGSPGWRGGPWNTSDWVPAPLANVFAGYDFNPGAEMFVNLNSAFSTWHFDINSEPPSDKLDLYSVALHEIGHGMGFAGSAVDTCGGCADLNLVDGQAYTFDRHVSFGDVPILDARQQGDPNAILTSGNLNFNLGGDRKFVTHAPGAFINGSSYSHFDELVYGTESAGALMTPSLNGGESQRQLDGPTVGVLAQIGWPLNVGVSTPTIDSVTVNPGQIQIEWSEDLFQSAVPAHYYNVSAYRSGVLDAAVDVSWSENNATLTNIQFGSDYEIVLTPVSATQYGAPAKVDVRSANDPSDPESPSAPGQPIIDSQDEGRNATISWPPSTDNVGVDKYRVYQSDGSLITTVTGTSAQLSLDIGTHNIYVQAVDAAGNVSGQSPQVQIVINADPIQDIANDPSFTSTHADVLRLYWAFFNRDPDTAGAQYWIDISNQGFSLDVIAEQFAVSQEFQNTYGSTGNEDFLRIVYFNVLGRAADLSGYSYWLGQMNAGLSRGGVVRWIAANNEFVVQHPYPS